MDRYWLLTIRFKRKNETFGDYKHFGVALDEKVAKKFGNGTPEDAVKYLNAVDENRDDYTLDEFDYIECYAGVHGGVRMDELDYILERDKEAK